MKKIELESTIEPLDGEPATEQLPTYRKLLQLAISNSKARTADEARRITRIVPKLKGKEAEFTDEEFKLLKQLVEANQAQFSGYIQGMLLEKIDPTPKE